MEKTWFSKVCSSITVLCTNYIN